MLKPAIGTCENKGTDQHLYLLNYTLKKHSHAIYRPPAHWGLGEIDGLLVSPGKASNTLTDHLIPG